MMSDLIKQAKEYADLSEVVTTTFYDDENEEWSIRSTTIGDVLDSVCDDYTVFPSTQQWIPVSERLPIDFLDRRILVSTVSPTGRRSVDVGLWEGGKWTTYFPIGDDRVTAWMPLPDPYKGGDAK